MDKFAILNQQIIKINLKGKKIFLRNNELVHYKSLMMIVTILM